MQKPPFQTRHMHTEFSPPEHKGAPKSGKVAIEREKGVLSPEALYPTDSYRVDKDFERPGKIGA